MKRPAQVILLSLAPLWSTGCAPPPVSLPQLSVTTVSRQLDADLKLPQIAPQMDSLDFSLAEYDREAGRVFLVRPLFEFQNRVREEQRTKMQSVETSREVVNPDGTTRTVVERKEVPVVETMEVAYTECVWLRDQILSCPITGVLIFDAEGRQLSAAQVEAAFKQERRVVLQAPGAVDHAYYRAFLHPDVLYIQSHDWFDENGPSAGDAGGSLAPAPVINETQRSFIQVCR